MNYKNVLNKRKRNKRVKEVMKELKLTLKDFNLFVPFDEAYKPFEKMIRSQLRMKSNIGYINDNNIKRSCKKSIKDS